MLHYVIPVWFTNSLSGQIIWAPGQHKCTWKYTQCEVYVSSTLLTLCYKKGKRASKPHLVYFARSSVQRGISITYKSLRM